MRPRTLARGTLGLFAVLAGCSSSTEPDSPFVYPALACADQAAPGADWQTVERDGFRFRVPPDFESLHLQPYDSDANTWAANGSLFMSYDYGWYSNDLSNAQQQLSVYSECGDTIGGKPAMVIEGQSASGNSGGPASLTIAPAEGRYVIAATWRDVLPDQEPAMHLTIWAKSDRPEDRSILLAIIQSVEFTS